MDTISLLLKRARGEAVREDYVAWAIDLLAAGREERSIVKIAADPEIEVGAREQALAEILPALGYRMPKDGDDLIAILEEQMMREYSEGQISGVDLIQRCREFWRLSGYSPRFRIWHDLDEDIRLSDEGYGPIFHDLEKDDLEASILRVLRKEGRISNA
jgi:hypothetical protein